MKRITQVWNRLDVAIKVLIGVFTFYTLMYVILDILEEVLKVAI